ncbi:hypothetical protein HaLaN_06712 [Haematococcus lacustris]|uniref:Uncharacterized protein n=1 Tax=Haematococcus lacustris TaxID=44745 RepID=A0A699Z6X8_HAELA|nr:hypothetical protein HaLaN_06712 [Haematococcus lacustris]
MGTAYPAGKEGMGVSVVSWRGRLKRGMLHYPLPHRCNAGVLAQEHACEAVVAPAAGAAAQSPVAPSTVAAAAVVALLTAAPTVAQLRAASPPTQQVAAPCADLNIAMSTPNAKFMSSWVQATYTSR